MENNMQEMKDYRKSCIENLSNIIFAAAICNACLDNMIKVNKGLDKMQELSADLGEVDMNEYGKNWQSTLIKKVAEKTKMNESYIEKAVNKIFDRIRNDEDARAILRGNEIDPDKAMNEIVKMTEVNEKETATENLLAAKGFSEAVVTILSDSVDVVVNADDLTESQIAQIEDIVKRKTECSADKIVISPVGKKK